MKYRINTAYTSCLHVTGKKIREGVGFVKLLKEGKCVQEGYYKYPGYETFFFTWEPMTEYDIEIENLEVSLCYCYNPENVLEEGIEFLEFQDDVRRYNRHNLSEFLTQEYRNQIHFTPYRNWMNDPNGLCWYKGYYHLFYQHNPNAQVWGNMHWGHAVSKDLLHWVHQPLACYPQIELTGLEGYRGGAFSGSAVVDDDALKLIYTRHFGRDDRAWQRQWQVGKESRDGVNFSHEECLVWGAPEGVDWHFRDPKVVKLDGKWSMILAGRCFSRPAVFRYESEDLRNWSYKGILYQEDNPLYGIAECPDFFILDGVYVLVVSYIYGDGTTSEERDVLWYTGTYSNGRFYPEKQGKMDYGRDYYAPQSFEHEGRRISIGWNRSGNGTHISEKNGTNGSLSLPRVLSVKNGRVWSQVIEGVRGLLCDSTNPGPYELDIEKDSDGKSFLVILARSDNACLLLSIDGDALRLEVVCDDTGAAIPYVFEHKASAVIESVKVYMDKALVEIFINGGIETVTKRFYIKGASLDPALKKSEGWKITSNKISSIWEEVIK